MLSDYLVLGQTSGYQHNKLLFYLFIFRICIFNIQEIDCVGSYVFNRFNLPLLVTNEHVFKGFQMLILYIYIYRSSYE